MQRHLLDGGVFPGALRTAKNPDGPFSTDVILLALALET